MNNNIKHLENGDFEVLDLEEVEPFSWITSERFSEVQRKLKEDCANVSCRICNPIDEWVFSDLHWRGV